MKKITINFPASGPHGLYINNQPLFGVEGHIKVLLILGVARTMNRICSPSFPEDSGLGCEFLIVPSIKWGGGGGNGAFPESLLAHEHWGLRLYCAAGSLQE